MWKKRVFAIIFIVSIVFLLSATVSAFWPFDWLKAKFSGSVITNPEGPVFYLSFSDSLVDVSGNGYNAVSRGRASFVHEGVGNRSITFGNGGLLEIADNPLIRFDGDLVISFWVKIPSGAGKAMLIGKGNSDGEIDEGCGCALGATQACGSSIGQCRQGVQTCSSIANATQWDACVGELLPQAEVCDGIDNNCNGYVDEGVHCATRTSAGLNPFTPSDFYTLYRSSDLDGEFRSIALLQFSANNFTDIGLMSGITYHYLLRRYRGDEVVGYSTIVSINVPNMTSL